jgi:hypothetical protein
LESCILVRIAQNLALSIKQALKRSLTRQLPHIDREVKRDVLTTVVKRLNRSTNLIQSRLQILLLPLPKYPIKVAMVQEEQRIARTVCRVTDRSKYTAYTKMPTSMDIALIETRYAFHFARKAGVVWLIHDFLDEFGVRECVHDPGDEVAAETVAGGKVEHELLRDEGTVLNATTASIARNVEWILLGSWLDVGAIATEPVVGTKDGRFVRAS